MLNPEPRWWDRAWIRQDFALSKNVPMVYFGHCRYLWARLQKLLWILETDREQGARSVGLLDIMTKLVKTRHTMIRRTDGVADIAAQLNRAEAADVRDKIYSILSLLKSGKAAMNRPDYKRGAVETFAKTTYDLSSKTGSFSTMPYISQQRPQPCGLLT